MNTIKDKLSATVRMAKVAQEPETQDVEAEAAAPKAAARVAARPATPRKSPPATDKAESVPAINSQLRPSAVWPD